MDKFGIFDILNKLASDKATSDKIINAVKNVANVNLNKNKQEEKSQKPKIKYSQTAILNLLQKHDKMSKEIDKNTKK